jgi:hypothetical protein
MTKGRQGRENVRQNAVETLLTHNVTKNRALEIKNEMQTVDENDRLTL